MLQILVPYQVSIELILTGAGMMREFQALSSFGILVVSLSFPQYSAVKPLIEINLGLFLGFSVFSICEVIEVVIEIFFILNKRHQRNVQPFLKI